MPGFADTNGQLKDESRSLRRVFVAPVAAHPLRAPESGSDFDRVLFWARLGAAQARKSPQRVAREAEVLEMLRPNEGFLAEFLRWRDSDVFTPREKAALALSESISRGDSRKQVERVLKRVRPRFKEGEMIQLLLSIRAIADWHDAHSRRADLRAGDSGQQR